MMRWESDFDGAGEQYLQYCHRRRRRQQRRGEKGVAQVVVLEVVAVAVVVVAAVDTLTIGAVKSHFLQVHCHGRRRLLYYYFDVRLMRN